MRARPARAIPSGFPYAAYFHEIRTLNQLQMVPQERQWEEKAPAAPQTRDVVLYLGCNVLRTAHLVQTVIEIFRLLDVDFAVVGGPAYCCGVVHHGNGDLDMSQVFGANSIRLLQQFQPKQVVMWCPSCIYYYDEILDMDIPFQVQHVTEFLVERLDHLPKLEKTAARVALHYHTGRPQRDREAACAKALLSAIPGVQLTEIGTDPRLGNRHCTAAVQGQMGKKAWDALVCTFMDRAKEAGVNTFATLYHGCQRMLCGYEPQYPFVVENYISLLGRALGINHEDRFKKYLLWADEARILEDATPCMQANAVDLHTAQEVIRRSFLSG